MDRESFARWQSTTIQQLGYSINLVLALSTASLGFAFTLTRDGDFAAHCLAKALSSTSLLLFTLSTSLGIAVTLNRLFDFRKTAQIALDRERWCEQEVSVSDIDSRLSERRAQVRRLGDRTWWLFYCQIASFGTAVLLLIAGLGVAYRSKLF
jgi:hypothetical protein